MEKEHSHEGHETTFEPLFAVLKGEAEVNDIPERSGVLILVHKLGPMQRGLQLQKMPRQQRECKKQSC